MTPARQVASNSRHAGTFRRLALAGVVTAGLAAGGTAFADAASRPKILPLADKFGDTTTGLTDRGLDCLRKTLKLAPRDKLDPRLQFLDFDKISSKYPMSTDMNVKLCSSSAALRVLKECEGSKLSEFEDCVVRAAPKIDSAFACLASLAQVHVQTSPELIRACASSDLAVYRQCAEEQLRQRPKGETASIEAWRVSNCANTILSRRAMDAELARCVKKLSPIPPKALPANALQQCVENPNTGISANYVSCVQDLGVTDAQAPYASRRISNCVEWQRKNFRHDCDPRKLLNYVDHPIKSIGHDIDRLVYSIKKAFARLLNSETALKVKDDPIKTIGVASAKAAGVVLASILAIFSIRAARRKVKEKRNGWATKLANSKHAGKDEFVDWMIKQAVKRLANDQVAWINSMRALMRKGIMLSLEEKQLLMTYEQEQKRLSTLRAYERERKSNLAKKRNESKFKGMLMLLYALYSEHPKIRSEMLDEIESGLKEPAIKGRLVTQQHIHALLEEVSFFINDPDEKVRKTAERVQERIEKLRKRHILITQRREKLKHAGLPLDEIFLRHFNELQQISERPDKWLRSLDFSYSPRGVDRKCVPYRNPAISSENVHNSYCDIPQLELYRANLNIRRKGFLEERCEVETRIEPIKEIDHDFDRVNEYNTASIFKRLKTTAFPKLPSELAYLGTIYFETYVERRVSEHETTAEVREIHHYPHKPDPFSQPYSFMSPESRGTGG